MLPVRLVNLSVEICILAGGLSSRMEKDKSRLRLHGKTLLAHVRQRATATRLPVRVIRRDLVERCGPLGGIFTALKTTSAGAVLFLACDMPQVSEELLRRLIEKFHARTHAVFTLSEAGAGFPILLRRDALPVVKRLLAEKQFSLQMLARTLSAKKFQPNARQARELFNVNTPADWLALEKILRTTASRGRVA